METTPATPAPVAATPASVPAVPPVTPAASPAPSGQENVPVAGTVTLSEAQYRNLLRDQARAKAMDKRAGLVRTGTPLLPGEDGDPALVERFNQSEAGRLDAEKRAMQAEVRGKVRDLVDDPKYANIPKSTRDLILQNPAMLSTATSLDEAMIDIEQWLGEQAAAVATIPGQQPNAPASPAQVLPTRETPPTVTQANPAPADAAGMEDVSELSGPLKTQAMIRNKVKEGRGVQPIH